MPLPGYGGGHWSESVQLLMSSRGGVDVRFATLRVSVEMLRVLQEALDNVRKHACARRSVVRVERRASVLLSVHGDGTAMTGPIGTPEPSGHREGPVGPAGCLRVMLVDDHPLVRAAVRQSIEGVDVMVVEEAATVPEALERAKRSRPDVVLVDIDLGGADGIQLVRELSPHLPNTTFVMLSVSASDSDLLDAIMAGARGYLTKDVSPEALLRAVRSARRGELAMPRAMAARLVQRLADAARVRGGLEELELVRLSAREREVLRLVATGSTDREIARALTISPRTAETHVAAILRKLEVRNRSEAAMLYRRGRPPAGSGTTFDRASI